MHVFDFFGLIAAVIVGNALTVLVVYVTWRATKAENQGGKASDLPASLLLAALVPMGIVIAVAWSLTT